MFVGKKGLSDVVTNILIILLVLVAVGILWFFIRPTLEKGASGVQGIDQCLIVDVKAKSCAYVPTTNPTSLTVNVERGVGEGDLKKVNFILFRANGDSVVVPVTLPLAVYGSQLVSFYPFGAALPNNPYAFSLPSGLALTDVKKASVGAIVGEQEKECRPLNQPVNCA